MSLESISHVVYRCGTPVPHRDCVDLRKVVFVCTFHKYTPTVAGVTDVTVNVRNVIISCYYNLFD